MAASHGGHSEVVRLLLTADANINIRSQVRREGNIWDVHLWANSALKAVTII